MQSRIHKLPSETFNDITAATKKALDTALRAVQVSGERYKIIIPKVTTIPKWPHTKLPPGNKLTV